MQFKTYSQEFKDSHDHAFMSPSKYHWINYDTDKLTSVYSNHLAKQRGTRLHEFAKEAIELGIKLQANKSTISMYVNDAIGYRMTPEQLLYYSDNCYGTADAISFRKNMLRIHDLKTGTVSASMHQLEVYAALFCLDYGYKPEDIKMELRIYQSSEIMTYIPIPEDITAIMKTIVEHDKIIEVLKIEG